MRYLGGKTRIAKQLATVIDSVRKPGQLVWDAFCGGLSMSVALRAKGPVWSTDTNAALIALYRAVQCGWEPPSEVSKATWTEAKSLPDHDPMKAFCGLCCSFAGSWFRAYETPVREQMVKTGPKQGQINRHFQHRRARQALKSDAADAVVACVDFFSVQPSSCEAIMYLDPPYAGRTGFRGVSPFESEKFVRRVSEWARWTHVFVSEYDFPIGECVLDIEPKIQGNRPVVSCAKAGVRVIERLYYIGPQPWADVPKQESE